MATAIHNRICLINLFIILTFFIGSSSKTSLSDIKLMCGTSSKDALKTFPQDTLCTAVVWSSSDDPKQEVIDALNKNLKRACIYDDDGYSQWFEDLDGKDSIKKKVKKLGGMIDDTHIDIIIFDYMYMPAYENYDYRGYLPDMQTRLYDFFTKLHTEKPDLLFGVMLRNVPDPGFNFEYLNEVVPFYVFSAVGLSTCNYNSDQSKMKPEDPAPDVEALVKGIVHQVNNSNKVCLGIKIAVDSSTSPKGDLITDSYSTFCSKKPIVGQRFCVESLSNYYEKGKLVSKYKLGGSIIYYYDYDDLGCNCKCGCHAATTAINAGVHGDPAPNVTKCTTWTLMFDKRNNP